MKKYIILLSVGFFILLITLWYTYPKISQSAPTSLPWEIVYVERNNDILDVYTISANGTNKKLLYHNTDTTNGNSLLPHWSADGSQISFAAMKDGEWSRFTINANGTGIIVDTSTPPDLLSRDSRESDIIVENGSIYYASADGKKTEVYHYKFFDPKFHSWATEVSWSPDKKYMLFEVDGSIYVLDINMPLKAMKITDGQQPDWKY